MRAAREVPARETAEPARGLGGAVRRAAYGIPEHHGRRWMLLLVADRLDWLARRSRSRPALTAAVALVLVGALVGVVAGRPGR